MRHIRLLAITLVIVVGPTLGAAVSQRGRAAIGLDNIRAIELGAVAFRDLPIHRSLIVSVAGQGAEVVHVGDDAEGRAMGVRPGDIIVSVDDVRVRGAAHLQRLLSETSSVTGAILAVAQPGGMTRIAWRPTAAVDLDAIDVLSPLTGRLAIEAMDLTPQLGACLGSKTGALVTVVREDSAGARLGLRAGDVITHVNGRRGDTRTDLETLGGEAPESLVVSVVRRGRPLDLAAAVGRTPPGDGASKRASGDVGLGVQDIAEGAMVFSAFGAAARVGLAPSDVITIVAGEKVRGAEHVVRILREATPGKPVALTVVRQGAPRTVTIDVPAQPPLSPRGSLALEVERQRFRSPELEASFLDTADGVILLALGRKGLAERSGLRVGDLLVMFDGEAVTGARHLLRTVGEAVPGRTAVVQVRRDGTDLSIPLRLTASPDPFFTRTEIRDSYVRNYGENLLGVTVVALTPQLAAHFGAPAGAFVTAVPPDSRGAAAGVAACDVITRVSRSHVREYTDMPRADRYAGAHPLEVDVIRHEQALHLTAPALAPADPEQAARGRQGAPK